MLRDEVLEPAEVARAEPPVEQREHDAVVRGEHGPLVRVVVGEAVDHLAVGVGRTRRRPRPASPARAPEDLAERRHGALSAAAGAAAGAPAAGAAAAPLLPRSCATRAGSSSTRMPLRAASSLTQRLSSRRRTSGNTLAATSSRVDRRRDLRVSRMTSQPHAVRAGAARSGPPPGSRTAPRRTAARAPRATRRGSRRAPRAAPEPAAAIRSAAFAQVDREQPALAGQRARDPLGERARRVGLGRRAGGHLDARERRRAQLRLLELGRVPIHRAIDHGAQIIRRAVARLEPQLDEPAHLGGAPRLRHLRIAAEPARLGRLRQGFEVDAFVQRRVQRRVQRLGQRGAPARRAARRLRRHARAPHRAAVHRRHHDIVRPRRRGGSRRGRARARRGRRLGAARGGRERERGGGGGRRDEEEAGMRARIPVSRAAPAPGAPSPCPPRSPRPRSASPGAPPRNRVAPGNRASP